jgi:hypothetical protein
VVLLLKVSKRPRTKSNKYTIAKAFYAVVSSLLQGNEFTCPLQTDVPKSQKHCRGQSFDCGLPFIGAFARYSIFAALGASLWNSAFILAFTLPNLFRRLLGEGGA